MKHLPYGEDGAVVPVQKFRDVQKLYAAMTDGKMEYVLYGVENQADIHYAMAVKNNLYDALEYAGQVEEVAKSHRKKMRRKKEQGENFVEERKKIPNAGEFLSGFWAGDRLIPSITVTIFFGSQEWNGPLSLFEMMDVSDPNVLACMDNYHVRLIAPAQMLVERRAADVIEAITNSGIKYKEEDEVVNVCQAIQEMRKESEQNGERIGELKKAQEVARNFYNLGIDVEKIAQGVGYAVETVKGWLDIEL